MLNITHMIGFGAGQSGATPAPNTVLLMHMDDTGLTDKYLHTVTVTSDAARSSTKSKFGGYSLRPNNGIGGYLSLGSSSDFGYGTGDFTIECWYNANGTVQAFPYILDSRTGGADGAYPTVFLNSGDSSYKPQYQVSGAVRITSSVTPNADWNHLAIVRASGTTTMWLNGSSAGTWGDATNYATCPIRIGAYSAGGYSLQGYIDEMRIAKSAIYTTAFTPPTEAFPDP